MMAVMGESFYMTDSVHLQTRTQLSGGGNWLLNGSYYSKAFQQHFRAERRVDHRDVAGCQPMPERSKAVSGRDNQGK